MIRPILSVFTCWGSLSNSTSTGGTVGLGVGFWRKLGSFVVYLFFVGWGKSGAITDFYQSPRLHFPSWDVATLEAHNPHDRIDSVSIGANSRDSLRSVVWSTSVIPLLPHLQNRKIQILKKHYIPVCVIWTSYVLPNIIARRAHFSCTSSFAFGPQFRMIHTLSNRLIIVVEICKTAIDTVFFRASMIFTWSWYITWCVLHIGIFRMGTDTSTASKTRDTISNSLICVDATVLSYMVRRRLTDTCHEEVELDMPDTATGWSPLHLVVQFRIPDHQYRLQFPPIRDSLQLCMKTKRSKQR